LGEYLWMGKKKVWGGANVPEVKPVELKTMERNKKWIGI